MAFELSAGAVHEVGAKGDFSKEGGQSQGKRGGNEKDNPVGVQRCPPRRFKRQSLG